MLIVQIGHGGQTEDLDGDEDDGYDEVIYPVDFRTAGHIVDDELHRILYVLTWIGILLFLHGRGGGGGKKESKR